LDRVENCSISAFRLKMRAAHRLGIALIVIIAAGMIGAVRRLGYMGI
jgi:hypothetical protein